MTGAVTDFLPVAEYQSNSRALDFLSIRNACPKGMYLTALPEDGAQWEGVLFARKGPYAPGIFRFHVSFPNRYPERPPVIIFTTDVFHPLICPLTTYTYSNQDNDADTVSATDEDRLPPGAFSLRHGFPDWFSRSSTAAAGASSDMAETGLSPFNHSSAHIADATETARTPDTFPHISVVLYYLRAAFTSEDLLDSITMETAANPSAWHAWRTFRMKRHARPESIHAKPDASLSPSKQQPGGARSPGDWNWHGVWEDRLRKCVQASLSEQSVFKKPGLVHESVSFILMPLYR